MTDKQWGQVEHFKKSEFACKCGCGFNYISFELVRSLDSIRRFSNMPITINSGSRCPEYNKAIGGSETSSHLKGLAADVKIIDMESRARFMEAQVRVGAFIERVGMAHSFIHVDVDRDKPEGVWLY